MNFVSENAYNRTVQMPCVFRCKVYNSVHALYFSKHVLGYWYLNIFYNDSANNTSSILLPTFINSRPVNGYNKAPWLKPWRNY